MAAQRGLAFELGRLDVTAFVRARSICRSKKPRAPRATASSSTAPAQRGAQAVAVGHTADDQVETVLMHLLRGAGVGRVERHDRRSLHEGWDASIPLVRPLLGIWREEIEAYCRERGLSPLQDASNQDTTYLPQPPAPRADPLSGELQSTGQRRLLAHGRAARGGCRGARIGRCSRPGVRHSNTALPRCARCGGRSCWGFRWGCSGRCCGARSRRCARACATSILPPLSAAWASFSAPAARAASAWPRGCAWRSSADW